MNNVMGNACLICNHSNRLQIDRKIVNGGNLARIARLFGVQYDSLRNHAQNHIARQLAQAYEKKQLAEDFDLLTKIDQIITRTEEIFKRNFKRNRDALALKALDSQRNTIELLAKISYSLHQAKLAELEIIKVQSGESEKERLEDFRDKLAVLTENELIMLQKIQEKIANQSRIIIIPDEYTDFEEITETEGTPVFKPLTNKTNNYPNPTIKRVRKHPKTA